MRKHEELSNPESCLNRADDGEFVFVLLEHDVAAPAAIRAWARVRVARGKNLATDPQIREALHTAQVMAGFPCHQKEREHWCDRDGPGGFMGHTCVARAQIERGCLLVGHAEDTHQVVVSHPDLDIDHNGEGHIVFSPAQARNLAVLLIEHAHQAEAG